MTFQEKRAALYAEFPKEAAAYESEFVELQARLAEAEGVLRVIANTDYRGNRSTEAMAAKCYFDSRDDSTEVKHD
jgi:hypothetical protein